MHPRVAGRFITLEGGEGTGKTTQVKRLAAALEARGLPVITTREPGGAPGAEAIRRLLVEGETGRWDPLAEALLHAAARRTHLVETVWPALVRGTWVISDRFADSTAAYQGYGLGLPGETLRRLHRLVTDGFQPALTLILDLPVDVGLARAGKRGGGEDRYERMGTAFHERLRKGFLEIAHANADRCRVIDASGTPEAVESAILAAVIDALRDPLSAAGAFGPRE